MEKGVPIVIGVAGHRDIRAEWQQPAVEGVREIFRGLMRKYTATPFILLSPLEAGADRMVAGIALESEFAARFRVIVPLPWRRELAPDRRPHSDPGGLDELLNRVYGTVDMDPGVTEVDLAAKGDELWMRTGAYVARHSQILIALWNEVEDPKSGTWRVIKWQREGRQTSYFKDLGVLDRPEPGPVYRLRVPRRNDPDTDPPPKVLAHEVLPPVGKPRHLDVKAPLDPMLDIDSYNKDLAALIPKLDTFVKEGRETLLGEGQAKNLPREPERLMEHFARADAMARRMRGCTWRVQCWLFCLIIGAFLGIEVYAHKLDTYWGLLVWYLLLVISAGLLHWWASAERHQQRYLDYRALAEALRVQFHWVLAGLSEHVPDYYLRQFRSELDWIRQAVRNVTLASGVHSGSVEWPEPEFGIEGRLARVRDCWVEGQRSYLSVTIKGTEHWHHTMEAGKKITYWLAVAVACVLLSYQLCSGKSDHIVLIIIFVLAVASAMANEWNEKSGYGVDARRHQSAYELFAEAKARWQTGIASGEAQAIVRELGIEALSENADWVIQHRHRPIGTPSM